MNVLFLFYKRGLVSLLPGDQCAKILLAFFSVLLLVSPLQAKQDAALSFELLGTQYLSEASADYEFEQYSDVITEVKYNKKWDSLEFDLDAKGVYSLRGTSDNHLVVPELYFGAESFGEGFQDDQGALFVGRKLHKWSRLDDVWGIGIWQPHFRWDSSRPEPQGLTGVYRRGRIDKFHFTGFVSPLFIPSQGAHFEVVDGKLQSSNRWFDSPAGRVRLFDESTDIQYRVERPDTQETVLQGSLGFSVGVNEKDYGPWGQVSVADKPINNFHLGVDPKLNLVSLKAQPTIHPVSLRHTLVTGEAGWRARDFGIWTSYTSDRPRRPALPDEWLESSLGSASFFGVGIDHGVPVFRGHWVNLKWGYMRRWDGESMVPEDKIGNELSEGLSRFEFDESEVFLFQVNSKLSMAKKQGVDVELRYMYSPRSKGSMLTTELVYRPFQSWSMSLGVDILGADAKDEADTFFARNSGNDRVKGGLSYVF